MSWLFTPKLCGNGTGWTLSIRNQFKKKLAERLLEPHILSSRLRGSRDRYKIKLRAAGFRLVYEVRDQELLVLVIAVCKRDRNAVYHQSDRR